MRPRDAPTRWRQAFHDGQDRRREAQDPGRGARSRAQAPTAASRRPRWIRTPVSGSPRPAPISTGNWMHDDAPLMYAFNTGVGLFKDQRVLIADMAAYQTKTVYAHATGDRRALRRGRHARDDAAARQCLRVQLFRAAGRARRAAHRLPQCRPAPGHPAEGIGRRLGRSRAACPHGRRGLRLRRRPR